MAKNNITAKSSKTTVNVAKHKVSKKQKDIKDTEKTDTDSVVNTSQLHETVPVKGHEGTPFTYPYALESTIMLLIIFAFLLIASSYRRGRNYFLKFLSQPLSIRARENAFEDRTIKDTFILVAFLSNTIISQGIILYYGLMHFDKINASEFELMTMHLGICIGASALYFIFKLLFYKILCFTFGNPDSSRLTIEGFKSTQVILGFILLPIAALITINCFDISIFLILAIFFIILSQTIVILRSFKVFFHNLNEILYFILYLCAVEFVPVILIILSTIFTCNII